MNVVRVKKDIKGVQGFQDGVAAQPIPQNCCHQELNGALVGENDLGGKDGAAVHCGGWNSGGSCERRWRSESLPLVAKGLKVLQNCWRLGQRCLLVEGVAESGQFSLHVLLESSSILVLCWPM